jgi:hypothetical protein
MKTNFFCSQRYAIAQGALCSLIALLGVLCNVLPSDAQSLTVAAPQQISNAKVGQLIDGSSDQPATAPNASLVAFSSFAENLDFADADSNLASDVFMYNPATTPQISRQSVTSNGEQTASGIAEIPPLSSSPSISPTLPDGKYGIAFTSVAENLLTSEGYPLSTVAQVYLRLPFVNKTILVSRGVENEAGNSDSECPSVTSVPAAWPTFKVVFRSHAGNLQVPAFPSAREFAAIYLATVVVKSSTTIEVSTLQLFAKDEYEFSCPVISGDGRYIAFASTAPDLVPGRTTAGSQMFRFDLNKIGSGQPELLSVVPGEQYGQGPSSFPSISYSGDAVVFTTQATNLGISSSASAPKVALYKDGVSGLALVNKNAAGEPSNALYFINDPQPRGAISADGRLVTFADKGTNLVSPAPSTRMHVYVKGLESSSAAPVLVSKTDGGVEADEDSLNPVLGAKTFGSSEAFVAFSTAAANLGTPGAEGSVQRVFTSAVTVPSPPITRNYVIPVPPEAVVRNRKVTFTFIKFSNSSAATLVARGSETVNALANKVTYTLTVRGVGNRTRISRTSNRNRITISRLNPGTYTARYKATRTSSNKRSVSTKLSPQRKFKVT